MVGGCVDCLVGEWIVWLVGGGIGWWVGGLVGVDDSVGSEEGSRGEAGATGRQGSSKCAPSSRPPSSPLALHVAHADLEDGLFLGGQPALHVALHAAQQEGAQHLGRGLGWGWGAWLVGGQAVRFRLAVAFE